MTNVVHSAGGVTAVLVTEVVNNTAGVDGAILSQTQAQIGLALSRTNATQTRNVTLYYSYLSAARTNPVQTRSVTFQYHFLTIARKNAAQTRSATFKFPPFVTVNRTNPAPARTVALSQQHPLVVNRTNPAPARTVALAALCNLTIARTNAAQTRHIFIRIPPTQLRTVTFAASVKVSVSRTNAKQTRRVAAFTPLAVPGPFFACWADATETTFGPQHLFNDFVWSKAIISHGENGKPALAFELKNPKVGLLNPNRKQWLWFSWMDVEGTAGTHTPGAVYPLLFGHLVGLPKQKSGEKVIIKFQAEAIDAVAQLQRVAEALKVRPYYDALFLDPGKRDDPAAILEGYTKSPHYDRIAGPNSVSVSDWIDGEDGLEEFTAVAYRTLDYDVGQAPLTNVRVESGVAWNQTDTGIVDFGTRRFASYYGNIKQEWPTPGAQLGGGWSVNAATAIDENLVELATMATYTSHYQNTDTSHSFGDVMSVSVSMQYPAVGGAPETVGVYNIWQAGFLQQGGPGGIDGLDYPEVNIPAHSEQSNIYVCTWSIVGSLQLRYRAARRYRENIAFTLVADVQPTTVLPPDNAQTELISLPPPDVGRPLVKILNWSSVQGLPVDVGTVMFPNFTTDPNVPGAQSFQICVVAGTAGETEPSFSDTVGEETTDGDVVWASLGTSPQLDAQDWTAFTVVPPGFVLQPVQPLYLNYLALVAPGLYQDIPTGTGVSYGQVVQDPNGNFQQCTVDGITGIGSFTVGSWGSTHGAITNDGTVEWTCIGSSLPDGEGFFLCISGGETDEILPDFNYTLGVTTSDAGAVWKYIGALGDSSGIPVGGTAGHVRARSYFTTDRGRWSAEYLLARARARLLWRARHATVSFDCSWDRAIALSCRKNALVHDDRLPGGQAKGKITNYQIICDANALLMKGRVTISCAAGNGNTLNPGGGIVLASGDVAYAPPAGAALDDGIVFPITDRSQITIDDEVVGSMTTEKPYVDVVVKQQVDAEFLPVLLQREGSPSNIAEIVQGIIDEKLIAATPQFPTWWKLTVKPVAGQTFTTTFNLNITPLMVEKQIDLEADAL